MTAERISLEIINNLSNEVWAKLECEAGARFFFEVVSRALSSGIYDLKAIWIKQALLSGQFFHGYKTLLLESVMLLDEEKNWQLRTRPFCKSKMMDIQN